MGWRAVCGGVYIDTCPWTGCAQVSPLTLGVYTPNVSIAVSIIFETIRPLVALNTSIPLY
eukprot:SAG22_NODE_6481_length_848_cov_1.753004_1_plen_59_part_10